jgi:hypothetical protein
VTSDKLKSNLRGRCATKIRAVPKGFEAAHPAQRRLDRVS